MSSAACPRCAGPDSHPSPHPSSTALSHSFPFLFESCWTENTRVAVGVAGVAFVQLRVKFMFAKRSCPRPSPNFKGYSVVHGG